VKIGRLLFFAMMFAPRTWQFFKIPLVAFSVIFIVVYYIRRNSVHIDIAIAKWFFLFLSYGVIWSQIGALNSNPGVFDIFRISVLWVILYALFVSYIDTDIKFNMLITTMIWATIAISFYIFALVLSGFGVISNINDVLNIDGVETNTIGIYNGFTHLGANNIGSLTFLVPFLICLYITKLDVCLGVSKKFLVIAIILSIVAVILTGRRVLWLELMVTPFILYIFNSFNSNNKSHYINRRVLFFYLISIIILTITVYIFTSYSDFDIDQFIEHFTKAFVEEDVRQDQGAALFRGFLESPLIGSGFGVGVNDVVRDPLHPWNYETSYILILFNTGIFGSTIYIICMGFVYIYGFILIKNKWCDQSIMLPLLVSFTCFIVANATNPYFASYDFMWVLFLPIAYININLLRRNRFHNRNTALVMTE
jgi:hypothetical protein